MTEKNKPHEFTKLSEFDKTMRKLVDVPNGAEKDKQKQKKPRE